MTTTTPRTIVLDLPLPPRELHPNSRVHWSVKATVTRVYRAHVCGAVREQLGWDIPCFDRVKVTLHFTVRRAGDLDNYIAAAKSLIDSLCAPSHLMDDTPRLGILLNDSPAVLVSLSATMALSRTDPPGVRVTLTEVRDE